MMDHAVGRRFFVSLLGLANSAMVLSGCALTNQTQEQQQVSLKQFQAYSDAATDAAIAAIQAVQADPKYANIVQAISPYVRTLQDLRQQVDGLTVADVNARAIAQHIAVALQQVVAEPAVMAMLGPAGVLISLSLAIISNFVDRLPPPPNAPALPPPGLEHRTRQLRALRHVS